MNKDASKGKTQLPEDGLPKSAVDISPDKKVDVLLALALQGRENIHQWETRAFAVSTWSIGIMLGVLLLWATRSDQGIQDSTAKAARVPIVVVVVLFGILTQFLLAFCRNKFMNNEPFGIAASNALGLFEPGQYFDDQPFFDPRKSWGPAWHIIAMELAHVMITVATALGILLT